MVIDMFILKENSKCITKDISKYIPKNISKYIPKDFNFIKITMVPRARGKGKYACQISGLYHDWCKLKGVGGVP